MSEDTTTTATTPSTGRKVAAYSLIAIGTICPAVAAYLLGSGDLTSILTTVAQAVLAALTSLGVLKVASSS